MIPKTAFLAAVCGLLVGCTPISTPYAPSADPAVEASRAEQRRARVAQHLASEDPDAKLPRITSVATMNRYANHFAKGCVGNINNMPAAVGYFKSRGWREVMISELITPFNYMRDTPENRATLEPEYAALVLNMPAPPGTFVAVNRVFSAHKPITLTNGQAVARIGYGDTVHDSCSVRMKVDDDAKLSRAMNQALAKVGRNGGPVSNTGIMGMGKAVADNAQVMIGRLYLKAPTAMRVLVMNRKHL